MRNFGVISPKFWIGQTGRKLRGKPIAQLIALYLVSAPGSNMYGVFYCSLASIVNDIGLDKSQSSIEASRKGYRSPFDEASEAIEELQNLGFCHYDFETEWVFVTEMARWQIAEEMKATDKRSQGVKNALKTMPIELARLFIERYNEPYNLGFSLSPFEAPSKPHRSQEQEQEQEKEQEQEYTHNKEGNTLVMEEPSFEPPVCYEDSLKTQIEKSSALTSAFNPIKFLSDEDVLDETQLVVAIKQFCKPCARNERTKALVATQTITLRAVRRACEIAKNAGKATPGYVIGILDNYAKDPDESFFQELNEDGIDEAEIARLFAKKEGK